MHHHISFKHPLLKILGIFSLLCISMVLFRIMYADSLRYLWMIWNLFLAWVPLFFVIALRRSEAMRKSTIRSSLLLLSWLVFFPNAPYILTDLFHLLQVSNMSLWYDLLLILSFAWTGLLTGFVSLIEIQVFFTEKFGKTISWFVTIIALMLGSFGVYLGRFGRFNSWEVITNPFELTHEILLMIINPMDYQRMYAMTFLFSCFLILSYLTVFVLINFNNTSVKKSQHDTLSN